MPPPSSVTSSAASSTDPPSDGEPATWQEFMTKYRHKKGDPPNTGLTMAAMGAKWQILKNQRFQRKSEQLLAEKMNQEPVSRKAMDKLQQRIKDARENITHYHYLLFIIYLHMCGQRVGGDSVLLGVFSGPRRQGPKSVFFVIFEGRDT